MTQDLQLDKIDELRQQALEKNEQECFGKIKIILDEYNCELLPAHYLVGGQIVEAKVAVVTRDPNRVAPGG